MKQKFIVLVTLLVLVSIGLITIVSPKESQAAVEFSNKNAPALDRVPKFQQKLDEDGFALHEGTFAYMDAVKECCQGRLLDTLGNNPWPSTYLIAQDMTPAEYPQPFRPWIWRLREDEAIVLIGQTPPKAAYFSFGTFIAFLPGIQHKVGIPIGDGFNNLTIKTNGRDPFNRPLVYIITGHRETEQRIRAAALAAGYPASIINVETVSPVIAPLGVGQGGSLLYLLHRVTIAEDPDALIDYIKQPPYKIFRVTPILAGMEPQFDPDPQPVPVLRVRGTGHTEMELYPALKRLRQAILNAYTGYNYKLLDTHVYWQDQRFAEKPFVGLQRELDVLGATRDTNYFATYPNFMLREGTDEFVIVYGVNHQATGKATYASFSAYADPKRLFGLETTYSPDFGDSARRFLPDDPHADRLYAWKVARHCAEGEPYCMEVTQPVFEDMDGTPYACTPELELNSQEMWLAFRTYLEPATKTGPDDNELLYDQAIYFGPYFAEP
jgi:hypothetical protein